MSVDPVTWWSPDPRALFELQPPPLGRSARKLLAQPPFLVTTDRAFADVMRACAAPAPGREETWITPAFLRAYTALHRQGVAHSVECWEGTRLAGGVYGLALGGVFCGESMFHRAPNASKLALYWLLDHLSRRGFAFLDSQVPNPATTRLGAVTVPRALYLQRLRDALTLNCAFN